MSFNSNRKKFVLCIIFILLTLSMVPIDAKGNSIEIQANLTV
ncbi:MAG: hypothetical protein ACTSPQ_20335 [Candidatus Helarchaeota archaeon]